MNLTDEVHGEIDKRKVANLGIGDLSDAEIVTESPCCGANLKGEDLGNDVIIVCSKCGGKV